MTRVNGRNPMQWQKMYRAVPVPIQPGKWAALRGLGMTDEQIEAMGKQEVWRNNLYVVMLERNEEGHITELSIRRVDRKPAHDWRDFQRIKTEIAGPDIEAVELYPREDRLMDTANQYYLYCLPPGMQFPFGYLGRNLRDADEVAGIGAVQRPLPDDWR